MSDLEIIKEYYGFNTKDAKFYMKNTTYKHIAEIKKDFFNNAKRSFYED